MDVIDLEEEKKKPGRPRKKNASNSIPHDGIVSDASDPRLWLDAVYDNPTMFKKIFTTFKNFDVEKIYVKFDPNGIKMYSPDSINKNNIYCTIDGQRMNRYYCKTTIDIIFSICTIKRILTELTKECSSITFTMTESMINNKITVITNEARINVNSYSTLEVLQNNEYKWEEIEEKIARIKDYPVSFELPAKFFKTKIVNLRLCADITTIEKNGNGNLRFTTPYKDEHGENITRFESPEKIGLKEDIQDDNIFAVSLYLEHIKTVATTAITNEINIYADKDKDVVFLFYLDQDEQYNEKKILKSEKARIYILTPIIRNSLT